MGSGSFGKVYEIQREEYGKVYSAALKVISIPGSSSEVNSVLGDGLSEKEVGEYFKGIVKDLSAEIAIMSDLKGHSNIVSYEDHKIVPQLDGLGWDILVRMELLTPLPEWSREHAVTEEVVIKIGLDICSALKACHEMNIIHRDIKPENIFVNKFGNFKLGDFGIARTIDKTMSHLSRKGTYLYMAPEVYLGNEYGLTADLYSLGTVLYRFLNGNRIPFLPTDRAIVYQDQIRALQCRMRGDRILPPLNGSEMLKKVILRSVEFDPSMRYRSAEEMAADLERCLQYRKGIRQETVQQEMARQEMMRQEMARQEMMRQEMARQEKARQEAAQQEKARQEAARQEKARQETARQEAARQEKARQEAARQESARQKAARQEMARQEAVRQEMARQEAERKAPPQTPYVRREPGPGQVKQAAAKKKIPPYLIAVPVAVLIFIILVAFAVLSRGSGMDTGGGAAGQKTVLENEAEWYKYYRYFVSSNDNVLMVLYDSSGKGRFTINGTQTVYLPDSAAETDDGGKLIYRCSCETEDLELVFDPSKEEITLSGLDRSERFVRTNEKIYDKKLGLGEGWFKRYRYFSAATGDVLMLMYDSGGKARFTINEGKAIYVPDFFIRESDGAMSYACTYGTQDLTLLFHPDAGEITIRHKKGSETFRSVTESEYNKLK